MKHSRKRLSVLVAACIVASTAGVAGLPGPAGAAPATVTIAGSLQSELGCPGDWQPECTTTHLAFDANDAVWQATFNVPAGAYEYKAAIDGAWTENYGLGGAPNGANIPLAVDGSAPVKFFYDHATHWVTDNVNSVIATAPGSYQSELGCAADWDPGCLRSWLQDPDGDGIGRLTVTDLPPGGYEFKVAIDESWTENYGAGGVRDGANIAFTVDDPGDVVIISYNQLSHVAEVSVIPATPVDDAALVREPVRHPFVDEILYFTLPDRFNAADPTNNCGDYQGACPANDSQANVLQHGYLPSDKGYYHGGDIEGLRQKLPYLDALGVTAIWVGPIFGNNPVQEDSSNLYGHSSGYHGYWILDFLHVDPHFGTDDDFARLVDESHDRGIKVFMDIITNHTADVIQLVGNQGYRNKTDFPYLDASGEPFDDSEHAYNGENACAFPAVDAEASFPYDPVVPAGMEGAKNPAWLNDPTLYHNRGNSTFAGESSLYGDFFGLDDLWTERCDVVEGMIDIYSYWITEYGVDGFRIDTTKHVNMEFWQAFGPAIQEAGLADFFAFGEVFDQQFGPPFLSQFSTTGLLPSTIDFAFQLAARGFASRGAPTNDLATFFAGDDWYTDSDSNAYAMPTFLGNHDMGRIGMFLADDNPGAADAELVARSVLAHALMYFVRGQPVVYYGDEQGFTGDGGDKDARQDMFANDVVQYRDDDLIGTDRTHAQGNFNRDHPLYRALRALSDLDQAHPALQGGAQIHRYSSTGPGIYAFSRIDRDQRIEYVVALNNSEAVATAPVPTYSPAGAKYRLISRTSAPRNVVLRAPVTGPGGVLNVTVPALGYVVYRADSTVPASSAAPTIDITSLHNGETVSLGTRLMDGHEVTDRIEVAAQLGTSQRAEVTFAVREGDGPYVPIGTDDNPPYRVFYDASHLRGQEATPLAFRAIVNDLSGHLASDSVVGIDVQFPEPPATSIGYAVIHYARADGDYGDHTTGDFNDFWGLHLWGDSLMPAEVTDWTAPKPFLGEDEYGRLAWAELRQDGPVNFIVHRGETKDPPGSPDRFFDSAASREIWLQAGDPTIYGTQAEAQGYATVHYACTDCTEVTLDATSTSGAVTVERVDNDDYGAVFTLASPDLSAPITISIANGGVVDIAGQVFTPTETPSAWFQPGEQVVHRSRGSAEGYATIHYRRPAGDYDGWGIHVWDGAATPTDWASPLPPVGQDVFGIVFEVPLAEGAEQLAYIIHRGEEKDPNADLFLVFDDYGHEVWQLQGANPARPYVAPLRR